MITNVDVLESDYDGVQFDFQKRMSNRWQMLAGLSLQRHKGFDHSGTYTEPRRRRRDFNNPNYLINRDDGSVFTELPWTFTLSGSYLLPRGTSARRRKYTARDGDPLKRRTCSRSPIRRRRSRAKPCGSCQRGEDRTETVEQVPRPAVRQAFQRIGIANLEGTLDLFNVLNANHVLLQNEALGHDLRPADPHPDAAHHPASA